VGAGAVQPKDDTWKVFRDDVRRRFACVRFVLRKLFKSDGIRYIPQMGGGLAAGLTPGARETLRRAISRRRAPS
jgi:hypothetical protein